MKTIAMATAMVTAFEKRGREREREKRKQLAVC
jgi:hypothetical protein